MNLSATQSNEKQKVIEKILSLEVSPAEKIRLVGCDIIESLNDKKTEVLQQIPSHMIDMLNVLIETKPRINLRVTSRVDVIFEYDGIANFLLVDLKNEPKKRVKDLNLSIIAIMQAEALLAYLHDSKISTELKMLCYLEAQRLTRELDDEFLKNWAAKNIRADAARAKAMLHQSLYQHLLVFCHEQNINLTRVSKTKKEEIRQLIVNKFNSEEWEGVLKDNQFSFQHRTNGKLIGLPSAEHLIKHLQNTSKLGAC